MPEIDRSKCAQRKRPLRTAILKRSKQNIYILIVDKFN